MITSRILRLATVIGFVALTATSHAAPILGCNAASRTNVDCANIYGGSLTDQGINFYTHTDYHVGYRRGVNDSPDFMDTSLNVTHHNSFATSVAELDNAEQGSGNTMVVEFDSGSRLSGMVLSGLSTIEKSGRDDESSAVETARVVAYNDNGEKVFDKVVEGEQGYVYVNFGDIVPQITTLLISSGGGLPGLTSTNTNIAYLITPLSEPGSALLILTGLGFLAVRRRFR